MMTMSILRTIKTTVHDPPTFIQDDVELRGISTPQAFHYIRAKDWAVWYS